MGATAQAGNREALKWAIVGAAEGLFLLVFLLAMERGNRMQLLLLIALVGGYTIIVLGWSC